MLKFFKKVHLIAACQKGTWGIAKNGSIPWHNKSDMQFFKNTTLGTTRMGAQNAIIMGRKTFSSIGAFLPGRKNYIITRNTQLLNSAHFYPSFESAIYTATTDPQVDKIYIIGGAEIYKEALVKIPFALSTSYISFIDTDSACDQYFPHELFSNLYTPYSVTSGEYTLGTYYPINMGEYEYLSLVRKVLETGDKRIDRTNIGTISTFGERMSFDISRNIPILTTKKIPWQMVIKELLWFISGSTNARILSNDGVHIWDNNSTREFLDARGLKQLPVGDIGAGYGHQWRHFGADYTTCESDYTGKGIDQLAEVIRLIRTEPTSRRILLTGWNPAALHQMALPPCHSIVVQFYVRAGEWLDCQMYQRSGDIGLGVPFNITSYSILVYMIAHVTGLKPGKFVHVLGDAHIYVNHIQQLQYQSTLLPFSFPFLEIVGRVENIDNFKIDNFRLHEYEHYPPIKMPFAT